MAGLCILCVVLCGAFVAFSHIAVTQPAAVLRPVLTGMAFFTIPLALLVPLVAVVWALIVAGAWAVRGPELPLPVVVVPDRVPDEWSSEGPVG